jgi:hypothetical protein
MVSENKLEWLAILQYQPRFGSLEDQNQTLAVRLYPIHFQVFSDFH